MDENDGDRRREQHDEAYGRSVHTADADRRRGCPSMVERAPDQGSLPAMVAALVGVGFAAFVAFDLFSGEERGGELAPIVAASGLVYLAAAALERPSASWLVFFVSVVVITAGKMGFIGVDATWVLLLPPQHSSVTE
jgi:hypothetical protein